MGHRNTHLGCMLLATKRRANQMTTEQACERREELLRLALPLMSRHGDGFTPVSYALWYEYVAGTCPALRAEIDALITNGRRLGPGMTVALHQKHLIDRAEVAFAKARTGLLEVIKQVQTTMT